MIRGYFDLRKIQLKVLQSQFSLFNLVNIDEIFKKKIVFDPEGPRATKLWAFKVCSRRGSNPGRPKSSDSLYKIAKNVASNPKGLEFFLTANFDGP